ncbi:MAG: 2Fe-2S iron-sulfur cluster binding domain-containing protein, partial [Pleurocapsa sp. SU_5_0]|nr:2Fe-2S iron-sulfur cluster binding domain-containing protein [Pleurocapsa sp. SU_5_0]
TNFANPSAKLFLISAGSGITPMMSMSRWICDTVSNVDIVFFYSARSPQDLIFRQELEMMSSRYPNFKLAITVTRSVAGQPWYGYRGRINEQILLAIAPDYQDRTVYVCGPNPFMEATKKLLQKINFPGENYYEESFGEANKKQKPTPTLPAVDPTFIIQKPVPAPATIAEARLAVPTTRIVNAFTPEALPASSTSSSVIVLSKSGQEVACDGKESILDAAEAEGAALPFGCRRGVCGACKVKKIDGEVIYDDNVACEDGFIYTCIARPVGRVVIEA